MSDTRNCKLQHLEGSQKVEFGVFLLVIYIVCVGSFRESPN